MAAAQRGTIRGPYREGSVDGRSHEAWTWSPDTAYAVGLLATDGNLSASGRHVVLTSNDRELLVTFLRCIRRSARIVSVRGGLGTSSLRVQIGDVGLYRWLLSIGLQPRKSLTLGPLSVPDEVFPHLLRGLLDGDGSIIDRTYRGTGKARGRTYRTLLVRFISASRPHVEWLRAKIDELFAIRGGLTTTRGIHRLTYAKAASLRLLPIIYPATEIPYLIRKREIWTRFALETGYAEPAVHGTIGVAAPPR